MEKKQQIDLTNEKHNTEKNVFTMKCKNSFIINMNEQLSFTKSFKSETFSEKCFFLQADNNPEYRRVKTKKNTHTHTKESCNMNSFNKVRFFSSSQERQKTS